MIPLINKENTAAADYDWPYGDMKDDTNAGLDDGNRVNRNFMTDAVQFFERIMDLSDLSPNNLEDNDDNGFQLVEALQRLTRNSKLYKANISQTVTNAPTVTVLGHNQIGSIVWTRDSQGLYFGTLTDGFPDAEKTHLFINPKTPGISQASIQRVSANLVTIFTADGSGFAADGILSNTSITIEVFP